MSVEGELDLYTAPRLHTELTAALSGDNIPSCLVVDMSGVGFCDSTGMNVQLAGPRPAVRKILQVTGLDSVFIVHDDPATVVPPATG